MADVLTVRAFHSVFTESDEHASAPATVDLAAMLVTFIRPVNIVEAGTYRGHMALALANMLRLFDSAGKVYTADPENYIQPALDHPDVAPVLPYVHYHQGDFLEMLATVPDPIGFAYIDASSVENPRMRWDHANEVYRRLTPGALMLVDDTASEDWADAQRFREWGRFNLHLPQHRGLTIIQKAF